MATSLCSYPKCPGYPLALIAVCKGCKMGLQYHYICQTAFEEEKGVSFDLMKRCYHCTDNMIGEYLQVKNSAAQETVCCPLSDIAPSTIATDIAPVREDFIPPSSIAASQEATAARTDTETLTQRAGYTNDGIIPPLVVTVAVVGNTEEVTPSTIATNVAPVRRDFIPSSSIGVSLEATTARTYTETLTQK